MKLDFTNQRIVVTGITGGIARATTELLCACGAEVIVSARSTAKLDHALANIKGNVKGDVMDLSNPVEIEGFFSRVGPFDHLVTPAASSTTGSIRDLDLMASRELLESKQWGQMLCVHFASQYLRKNGSITLFSGTVSQKPLPGTTLFAAVGAATEAAGRVWANELAPIRVNTLVPGIIATDIWTELSGSQSAAEEQLSAIADQLPVRRVGQAEEVAKAVAFLIDNGFINGSSLVIDGGHRVI